MTTANGRRSYLWTSAAVSAAVLMLGLFPGSILAKGADSVKEAYHLNGKFLAKIGVDFSKVVTSPVHWTGKDIPTFGAVTGATALVMVGLDHGTREWVEDHQRTGLTNFSLFITHFGEAPILLGLSAGLYAGGEAFHADGWRKTGLMCLESYAIDGLIVTAAKFLFARGRPLSGEGPDDFHWFSFVNKHHSFPSGHSASAFAVASVIAGQSDSIFVGIAAYGLASLVAISRVNNNEHWASDIVAGSALGYFIGKEILALNRTSGIDKPVLTLAAGPGGFGLSLRF